MTTYIWPEGGGGGPTGPDHIAPKYLIGNVPAGDSAVAYSQDGFIYLPDTGDGAAIQQALLAIAGNPSTDPPTPAVPGDVWIRPGTYDLTAGAVLLPLTVPAGTRVQGAGESTILTATLTTGTGTLFALEARTDLRDLVIEATDEGDSTGDALVQTVDGTAHCERLHVTLTRENTSTSTVLAAFGNAESARLEQDRCLVELSGTTATAGACPPVVEPVEPPAPTGTTWTVGTLGGENFPDLATALASGSVVNGDRLLLSAQTFTVAATITVAKQVTIQGAGLASTVLQTAATGADPVTVINVTTDNVTIRDLTVKQRRTTNTSIETAISINPPGGGAGALGHFIEAVRVETMEFGIVIRSDDWQINNCQLAYVGPNNTTRRLVATYRSNGQGLFCNSTFDSGQNGVITGNTRVFSILTTTGLPTELTGGYLRLGNITPSNAFPVQQFVNCEWFPTNPNTLAFVVDGCTTNETSAFVVFTPNVTNILNNFSYIAMCGNTLTGQHSGGTKGMFALDNPTAGPVASGSTTFYAGGNTIATTAFRPDFTTAMNPIYVDAATQALMGHDAGYTDPQQLITPGPLVPPTAATALAGFRLTGGVLRLDLCRVEGGDAHVVLTNATGHIDQCEFDGFASWGVYAEDTDLTVTGGTTLISDSESATAVQMVEVNGDPDLLFHARIDLPIEDATTTGILANTRTGQITGSKIQAATGIDTSAGIGPGFTIVANVVESVAGQQILPSAFDEVAHNITY